jgi:hypothetical protein
MCWSFRSNSHKHLHWLNSWNQAQEPTFVCGQLTRHSWLGRMGTRGAKRHAIQCLATFCCWCVHWRCYQYTCRGRLVHVLVGRCTQVLLSFILALNNFLHHRNHSVIICFLTGLLCMLNAYHIITILIILSSYWFGHLIVFTTVVFIFFLF